MKESQELQQKEEELKLKMEKINEVQKSLQDVQLETKDLTGTSAAMIAHEAELRRRRHALEPVVGDYSENTLPAVMKEMESTWAKLEIEERQSERVQREEEEEEAACVLLSAETFAEKPGFIYIPLTMSLF